MRFLCVVAVLLLLVFSITEAKPLGCMHNGKRVSWWFMYSHPDPSGQDGRLRYTVLSSLYKENTADKMYSKETPLGETMDQLDMSPNGQLKDSSEHWVAYNDQLNDGVSSIKLKDLLKASKSGQLKSDYFEKTQDGTVQLTSKGREWFANEANPKWWGENFFSYESDGNSGHEKGVMGFNKEGGFWIIHSLPNFPVPDDGFSSYENRNSKGDVPMEESAIRRSGDRSFLPKNAGSNGQHFFCFSYDGQEDSNRVLSQLSLYRPRILAHRLTEQQYLLVKKSTRNNARDIVFENTVDKCSKISGAENSPDKTLCDVHQMNHQTVKSSSVSVEMFAKNVRTMNVPSKYGKFFDMWLYVQHRLFKNGKVQTWQSGKPSQNQVDQSNLKNVKTIEIDRTNIWSYGKDHAKYMTEGINGKWTCMGGLNRGDYEHKRYGGSVCIQNDRLHGFLNRITRLELSSTVKKKNSLSDESSIDGSDSFTYKQLEKMFLDHIRNRLRKGYTQ